MIDLHTHILPGIDDGVKTLEEAVAFAETALADGVRTVVATPHCKEGVWDNDRAAVLAAVERLRQHLATRDLALDVRPGAEVHICPDLVRRLRDGRAPTLDDNGKTVLLELSLTQYPVELENLVFQLKLAGFEVVFAHPERIRYFQDDVARYESVIRLGAYGQITTGSVVGSFGSQTQRFSEEILRRGLVHVLASDAHNVRGRPPILGEAQAEIAAWIGEPRARSMTTDAPAALLAGRAPELPPVERRGPARGSFLGRWFRRSE